MSPRNLLLNRRALFTLALLFGAAMLPIFCLNGASAQGAGASASRPNGKIAFVFQHLYTVNPDGSGQTKIIDSSDSIRYPAWSPDASKIAFSRNVFPVQNLDIFVANADGSNVVRLTNAGNAATGANTNYGVSWSPDGTRIAFTSTRGGNSDIWVMNSDGSNPSKPDGEQFALRRRPGLVARRCEDRFHVSTRRREHDGRCRARLRYLHDER